MFTISGIAGPFADDLEAAPSQSGSAMMLIATMMPSERANSSASKFLATADPLAILQPLFVDRLHAQEHVLRPSCFQTRTRPCFQQNVAAGLQVVLLPDAALFDRLGDRVAVLGVDERHVVDDEHARLANVCQILAHHLWTDLAVAAAIEGPGAAKGAVPGAAARELDRRAGSSTPMKYLRRLSIRSRAGSVAVERL